MLVLSFIKISTAQALSLKRVRHAIGSSAYKILNISNPSIQNSTYHLESMTPFTEVRLSFPHRTDKSQISFTICNRGPCSDPSSGKKIHGTFIESIKRRIRINSQNEVRLPVACECHISEHKILNRKCLD